jgi:hypothetical protein
LTQSTPAPFASMLQLKVELEKAIHPEWKAPKFFQKTQEMPNGGWICLQGRRGAPS